MTSGEDKNMDINMVNMDIWTILWWRMSTGHGYDVSYVHCPPYLYSTPNRPSSRSSRTLGLVLTLPKRHLCLCLYVYVYWLLRNAQKAYQAQLPLKDKVYELAK